MYKQHFPDQPKIETLLDMWDELRPKEKIIDRKQQDYSSCLLPNELSVNVFPNNRRLILRPIEHCNPYLASDMDVVAAEKIAVKRKLSENAAAFKTNPTNTIIGGAQKRIRTCFGSSCTASSSNQRKAPGLVNITGQKTFTLKLQPTAAQLLDLKISIFEAPKDVAEE